MKVTIKDCLSLDVFKSCQLVAGGNNLNNRVRSVSVLDATDLDTAIKNNGVKDQLVLTSFYGMSGNEPLQKEVITALAECGISGIVVFHTATQLSEADKDVVSQAEKLNLPFILVPSTTSAEYSDVIEQIMDKMLYGDNFNDSLINNTIYHLLNFEKHSNFQSALKEAAVSNQLQVVLLSKDFNPILVVETRHMTTISDAIKTLKEQGSAGNGMYSRVNIQGVLTYWGRIVIEKESYFLLIVDNDDNYSAGEITKVAEIIQLAMGMWKYTPERDVKAEFIKSLMRGNRSLAYTLRDEIGMDADRIVSVFSSSRIDIAQSEDEFLFFEKKYGFEIMRIREGEETYGIILRLEDCGDRDVQWAKHKCLELFDKLKEGGKSIRIFHVTGLDGVEGAADGFRLITETMAFVEHVFPYKRVFTKYDLVLVSNCINIQEQGGYLKKTYVALLEPFDKEMGENKAKQLLETLETFVLDAGMNSAKTAESMGVHTNTVQYRLKKINDILGAEITGNRVIPALTIALALRRLEKVCG